MRLPNPYRCDGDGCEQVKGPTNRWWLLEIVGSGGSDYIQVLHLCSWDDESADGNGVRHLCSEACVSKALSQWMAQAVSTPRKDDSI